MSLWFLSLRTLKIASKVFGQSDGRLLRVISPSSKKDEYCSFLLDELNQIAGPEWIRSSETPSPTERMLSGLFSACRLIRMSMRALATSFGYIVTQGGKPLGIGRYLPDFGHSPLHPRRYPRATGCLACLTPRSEAGRRPGIENILSSRLLKLDVSHAMDYSSWT